MRGTAKTTFISPISYDLSVVSGKRVMSPYFYLLTPGSDPLKLEYKTKAEAKENRIQLLQSPGAHSVPTMKLFWAILGAVQELVDASVSSAG